MYSKLKGQIDLDILQIFVSGLDVCLIFLSTCTSNRFYYRQLTFASLAIMSTWYQLILEAIYPSTRLKHCDDISPNILKYWRAQFPLEAEYFISVYFKRKSNKNLETVILLKYYIYYESIYDSLFVRNWRSLYSILQYIIKIEDDHEDALQKFLKSL